MKVTLGGQEYDLQVPPNTVWAWEALTLASPLRRGAFCLLLCLPDDVPRKPRPSYQKAGHDPARFGELCAKECLKTWGAAETHTAAAAAVEFLALHVPTEPEVRFARGFSEPAGGPE
jgi:hypothetical protein